MGENIESLRSGMHLTRTAINTLLPVAEKKKKWNLIINELQDLGDSGLVG